MTGALVILMIFTLVMFVAFAAKFFESRQRDTWDKLFVAAMFLWIIVFPMYLIIRGVMG